MNHEPGCYGNGALGHQHTRERCADMLAETYVGILPYNAMARETVKALRGEMSDDAAEEFDACNELNRVMPQSDASWGWQDGDFGLWLCEAE